MKDQILLRLKSRTWEPHFDVEIKLQYVNASRSSIEIIPFEVKWDKGFSSKDVNIELIGNTTNIGINPTVVSISNSTNHKLFNLILEIPDSAIIGGPHFIAVTVTEIDSEVTQEDDIFFMIE